VRVIADDARDRTPALGVGCTDDHMRHIGVDVVFTSAGFEAERGGEAIASVEGVGGIAALARRITDDAVVYHQRAGRTGERLKERVGVADGETAELDEGVVEAP